MKKYKVNVNGVSYEVEVEEIGGVPPVVKNISEQIIEKPESTPSPTPVVTPPKVEEVKSNEPVEEIETIEGQIEITSPMPGNIWKITSSVGDKVSAGDTLLILEAMKMENEILAPQDGEVVAIKVNEGKDVDTGELLVIIG